MSRNAMGGRSGSSGDTGGGREMHPRLEISQLMTHPAHAKQRVLFLSALRQQQLRAPSDPASYYQLLGIHGAPFKAYRGVTPPRLRCNPAKQWCGYCHHGDSLFPTWHRAYLLFLERHLRAEAAAVGERLARAQPGHAHAWRAAAAAPRVPYWDFAGRAAARQGVPRSFETAAVLDLNTGKPVTVLNPLRQYRLPLDTGNPGDMFPRFSRAGTPTLRWPGGPAFAASNIGALNASVIRNSAGRWRESMRAVLSQSDWRCFSNHDAPLRMSHLQTAIAADPQQCPPLASLEFLHDLLHEGLGGPQGHLAHTGISAFDPLFLIIHSSIDRLLALWQLAHPGAAWAEAGNATMGTRAVPRGSLSKEKTEDWELRSYGAGKWIVTNVSDTRFPLAYAKGSSRLMKYFKGSNTEEKTFNLTTPTLAELKPKEGGKGKQGNYSFSLWLPTELQASQQAPPGESVCKDTPEPTDAELKVIEYPSMEVYVRVFSGFATEGRALDEASTLMDTLDEEGRDFGEDVVWLAVYDPPQKLQQRHNEVHIPAGKSQPQGQPVAAA
ncbi:hypothetical protein ABPG75_007257 [Micractinium tetrahymenae]